jgi:hypothetical protein
MIACILGGPYLLTRFFLVLLKRCTFWDIYGATSGLLLQFKLGWKLDISSFPAIYVRLSNSSR